MQQIRYNKQIDVYGNYDVVVIGAGPSGVCAAIASARQGMKVLLVESTGLLGGMATSGLVGPFMTSYDRDGEQKTVSGLFDEIISRLDAFSAVIAPEKVDAPSLYSSFIGRYHRRLTPFNSFYLQIVLDDMVSEAGVEVLCYTKFADCVVENGQIKYAVLVAPEGMLCVGAKVFIDCTGIAAVADKAGVPTYKGSEESGVPQPATLMFEVDGVDSEKYAERAMPDYPVKAYLMPTSKRYKINHFRVFSVDEANGKSLTDGHKQARRQVLDAYAVLKTKTPGFENAEIINVAPVLGVRESRHIEGEYKITVEDVSNGVKFEDRIAVYGFGMDVHRRSEKDQSSNFKIEVAKRYYIPYRSLVPKGCSNILVAGKTVSGESQAVGGIRCMPAAMAMGQAAGTAAAIALKDNVILKDVDIQKLQQQLKNDGAILD